MELSEINLRQTALILKSHGEYFFDSPGVRTRRWRLSQDYFLSRTEKCITR